MKTLVDVTISAIYIFCHNKCFLVQLDTENA